VPDFQVPLLGLQLVDALLQPGFERGVGQGLPDSRADLMKPFRPKFTDENLIPSNLIFVLVRLNGFKLDF
jgi:hypothetical protein